MPSEPLLELKDVTVSFGGGFRRAPFVALENLNLSIPASRPQIVAIAGESGSGKTTLGRAILGLVRPTGGKVLFEGQDIWSSGVVHTREFRRVSQAVFQDPFSVFNPFYPVDHLLRMPMSRFGIERKRAGQDILIAEALAKVGLKPEQVIGRFPHQLSGGQRQRIVVARALLLKPKLIVADEPVSMIDASLRANVLDNLKSLRDEQGISIIYITHDLATARQVSDQILVLYRGRAVEVGPADVVIGSPSHPYTQLLMNSVPRPDPDKTWPAETGDADAPDTKDRKACVFQGRCPVRTNVCATQPESYGIGDGHLVSCHVVAQVDASYSRQAKN